MADDGPLTFFFESSPVHESVPITEEMRLFLGDKWKTSFPYNGRPDMYEYSRNCMECLNNLSEDALIMAAEMGEPEAMIELGFRYVLLSLTLWCSSNHGDHIRTFIHNSSLADISAESVSVIAT